MLSLLNVIVETVWLLLPAAAANIAPVIAARYRWLPALNRPLDGNRTFHGKRLLGAHKTWRGLVVGIVAGGIAGFFLGSALLGVVLGAGALAGDAAKSFVKRQLNIAPGKSWPPFDQIDAALGALLAASLIVPITLAHTITALIIFGVGSYLVSYIGVQLKIKKSL
jgi:CDP-2,3-bis-(O-geranylgeranyl)-sn-glycerol synthase